MSDVIRLDSRCRSRKRYRWSPTGPRGRASRIDIVNTSPQARQIARLRLHLLKIYHEEIIKTKRSKSEVIQEVLGLWNSGSITFRKPEHVCRSTLYKWSKAYSERGFAALVPRYKYKMKHGAILPFMKLFPTYTKITIPGNPRTRGKHEFLPQLRRQWHALPLEGPIMVNIFFSMGIPKGTKMRRRMRMLRHQISHTGNPSLDRLIAFTLDCMNGIIFRDHSQIIRFHGEKEYRWNPEIRIIVQALSR